jgi:hypothetical protein
MAKTDQGSFKDPLGFRRGARLLILAGVVIVLCLLAWMFILSRYPD